MNRRRRHPGSERRVGFTLVEVLVTIVLMGIVLPVVMRAVTNALTAANQARHTAEAASLAEAKLNEIVAEMVASGGANTLGSSGDFGQEWPDYQWTCQTVTDSQGFTQVSLIVTWRVGARERSFNLSTMIWEG